MRLALALFVLLAACGSDLETSADLSTPTDLAVPLDLNLGVCDCLQQLCEVPCSQYIPGMYPTLGCDRCLHNGQQSPDMGCPITPAPPGQCGACFGIPSCVDQRF
jgi:hypothetical protein